MFQPLNSNAETPPDHLDDSSVACVELWISLGLTSKTHPVLQYAMTEYLESCGLIASCLEFEPFGALEAGVGGLFLHGAKFDPLKLRDVEMMSIYGRYPGVKAEVGTSGTVFFEALGEGDDLVFAEEALDRVSLHIAQGVAAAKSFILLAAMSLIDESAPSELRRFFAQRDFTSFCHSVNSLT